MKIETTHPDDQKRRWKIVRTDSLRDVPGDVVSADEDTGDCIIRVDGKDTSISFGAGGIKLVARQRGLSV